MKTTISATVLTLLMVLFALAKDFQVETHWHDCFLSLVLTLQIDITASSMRGLKRSNDNHGKKS
eukprot:scaffold63367_cov61-Attheya_sp.AAC.5